MREAYPPVLLPVGKVPTCNDSHSAWQYQILCRLHETRRSSANGCLRDEFVIDEDTISLMNQYEDITDDLHTDLHECLGHGSGQLLPGTDPDALKAYGSTIEEARADLFGLYYVADHKLVELGLTPNDEAYKAQYYG